MSSTEEQSPPPELLELIGNLSRFHHEHEKFYSQSPLLSAVDLEARSRVLKALARHWEGAEPLDHPVPSPFAGADDLNPPGLIAESGVLFMEGGDEPAEIHRLKADLEALAGDVEETGSWLADAMDQAWKVVGALAAYPDLADVLGERHQIVVSDWLAAEMQTMIARLLRRAGELLDRVDFSPAGARADLAGGRRSPAYLFSASELIDRAADLLTDSATLVHQNERRWRMFSARVAELSSVSR